MYGSDPAHPEAAHEKPSAMSDQYPSSGSQPQQPTAPPQMSPDGQFWWDGVRWVPAQNAQVPAPPTGEIAVPRSATPNIAAPPADSDLTRGQKFGLGVLGVLGLMWLIGACGPETTDQVAEMAPADQSEFLAIVTEAQAVAEDGNEVKIVEARKARGAGVCTLLPDLAATDWYGTVEDVSTTTGGDGGVLSLTVAEDIKVSTWNNGLSDIGSGTLIAEDSPLYSTLGTLEDDALVKFSGKFEAHKENCIDEQSLMDVNGVRTPDFTFKFSAIEKVE